MRDIEPAQYNRKAGWWIIGVIVGVIVLVYACTPNNPAPAAPRGSGGVTNLPSGSPTNRYPPPPVFTTPAAPVDNGIGEGVYEVGADMPAGKYKTPGARPDDAIPSCYYARLKRNDGSFGDIIANDSSTGQLVVTVKVGEYFKTSGCQGWIKQ